MRAGPAARRRVLGCLLAVLAVLLVTTGCTGGAAGGDEEDIAGRLARAKQNLDRAASINLTLSTEKLPDGVDGITAADGVATHAPAFKGTITLAARGLFDGQTVEVVAVGGEVYAQTPFTSSFIRVDPADFGAPDPATLMGTDTGLSTLLSEATDVAVAGEVRAGEQVLTEYTGIVPGAVVAGIFPTASPDDPFEVTFSLTGEDRLRHADVTGAFYGSAPEVTYDLTVEATDQPVEITPP